MTRGLRRGALIALLAGALLLGAGVFFAQVSADPPDVPVSPEEMVRMLGKGLDASWAQFPRRIKNYSVEMVRDIAAAGFRHIRLRTDLPADSSLFGILDREVRDCLDNGLIPIIAFGANEAEENPDSTHREQVIRWWRAVAEHYRDTSHRLLFDLFIELSGELGRDPDKVNRWYEMIVPAIRETNPTRILILSPVHLSNPFYLDQLRIPQEAFPYVMAEWHFYAAGPSKTNPKKLWTTGTEAERKLVRDYIQAGLDWQQRTGIPTWVGAWMPGNYNKGNDYTVPEQVVFASFLVRELEKAGIPWAVNAVHHFYDDENRRWIQRMLPVRDAVLDPWKIALYGQPGYGGTITRLGAGDYDAPFLREHGLIGAVRSIMVPDRMRAVFFEDSSFAGQEYAFERTDSCLTQDCAPVSGLSLRVENAVVSGVRTGPAAQNSLPEQFGCYPNPCYGGTTIFFQSSRGGRAVVKIFDLRGRLVKRLTENSPAGGIHRVRWDGRNSRGRAVPSGVYFVAVELGGLRKISKILLVR